MFSRLRRQSTNTATQVSGSQRDERSCEDILERAAAQIRRAELAAPAVRALAEGDVQYAWQLSLIDSEDYARFGISPGFKAAIKTALADTEAATELTDASGVLDERIRRFLLLPEPDGSPARRLRSLSAMYMSLLLVAPESRQGLMLSLLELMALVSGLMLPLPFELRRHHTTSASSDERVHMWTTAPSLDDAYDAVAIGVFFFLVFIVFASVAAGIHVVANGYRASYRFYDALFPIVGLLFFTFIGGCMFPLMLLGFWQGFNAAVSPYPLLAAAVACFVFQTIVVTLVHSFHASEIALELYHCPWLFIFMLRYGAASAIKARLTDKALEPLARERAAFLRAQIGLEDGSGGGRDACEKTRAGLQVV